MARAAQQRINQARGGPARPNYPPAIPEGGGDITGMIASLRNQLGGAASAPGVPRMPGAAQVSMRPSAGPLHLQFPQGGPAAAVDQMPAASSPRLQPITGGGLLAPPSPSAPPPMPPGAGDQPVSSGMPGGLPAGLQGAAPRYLAMAQRLGPATALARMQAFNAGELPGQQAQAVGAPAAPSAAPLPGAEIGAPIEPALRSFAAPLAGSASGPFAGEPAISNPQLGALINALPRGDDMATDFSGGPPSGPPLAAKPMPGGGGGVGEMPAAGAGVNGGALPPALSAVLRQANGPSMRPAGSKPMLGAGGGRQAGSVAARRQAANQRLQAIMQRFLGGQGDAGLGAGLGGGAGSLGGLGPGGFRDPHSY